MGDLILLAPHRAARQERRAAARPPRVRASFHFDLGCPFTYIAAERVERMFPRVDWVPVSAAAFERRCDDGRAWDAARARARELRIPLVQPDGDGDCTRAMRAAAYACEQGRGAAFVLAATRLAYCGGYDLDEPEVLAEAAAAAGIGLDACLHAAGDLGRDGAIEAGGLALLAAGATELPALRLGSRVFGGERRICDAAAASRVGAQPTLAG